MKRMVITILSLILLIAGCTIVDKQEAKIINYIVPNSYYDFTNTSKIESVKSITDLGKDYYTSVKEIKEGVQLELTIEQRDNLIQRNNEYIDELVAEFLEYNNKYRYKADDTYQKLEFYFDEKIPTHMQIMTVFGVASGYGLNSILLKNTTDWSVNITIFNCHTNKPVVTMNIPNEIGSYGAEEWQKSYN